MLVLSPGTAIARNARGALAALGVISRAAALTKDESSKITIPHLPTPQQQVRNRDLSRSLISLGL